MDKYLLELKQNSDEKGNIYLLKMFRYNIPVILFVLLLNEKGIFRCDKVWMRVGALVSIAFCITPQFIGMHPGLMRKSITKYAFTICTMVCCFVMLATLNFHVTLLYCLPLIITCHYTSWKLFSVTLVATIVAAIVIPLASYYMGLYDFLLLECILESVGGYSIQILSTGATNEAISFILLYLVFPKILVIAAISFQLYTMISHHKDLIETQYQLAVISETDVLTGLKNRRSYEQFLQQYNPQAHESIGCVFVDVNNLHEVNNELGHAAGDEMLIAVAQELTRIFGKENCFRIGGDEFVFFTQKMTYGDLEIKGKALDKAVKEKGYSISYGIEISNPGQKLDSLIGKAEKRMYTLKEEYYRQAGKDRRKR